MKQPFGTAQRAAGFVPHSCQMQHAQRGRQVRPFLGAVNELSSGAHFWHLGDAIFTAIFKWLTPNVRQIYGINVAGRQWTVGIEAIALLT